jgi:LAO/AO transport system kinase
VLAASARTGEGIDAVWEAVRAHREALAASGELDARRRAQARAWFWSLLQEGLLRAFRRHPEVSAQVEGLEREVEERKTTPAAAARRLLRAFTGGPGDPSAP